MPSREIIYLTGMMGAGKSVLGRRLADSLGWSFADLDLMTEQHLGRSVRQLFEQYGEEGFRRFERDSLRRASIFSRHVIALGGGTLYAVCR